MRTLSLLLALVASTLAHSPKSINVKSTAMPGVPRTERESLIALRDTVATWYCVPRERTNDAPCLIMRTVSQWNDNGVPDVFTQTTPPPKIDRKTAKLQFQKMFSSFCLDAKTHASHDEVCNNAVLMQKYGIAL